MVRNKLVSKILQAANVIANSSKNSQGNYVVTSSYFAEAILEIERQEKYNKRKRIIDKILKSDS